MLRAVNAHQHQKENFWRIVGLSRQSYCLPMGSELFKDLQGWALAHHMLPDIGGAMISLPNLKSTEILKLSSMGGMDWLSGFACILPIAAFGRYRSTLMTCPHEKCQNWDELFPCFWCHEPAFLRRTVSHQGCWLSWEMAGSLAPCHSAAVAEQRGIPWFWSDSTPSDKQQQQNPILRCW